MKLCFCVRFAHVCLVLRHALVARPAFPVQSHLCALQCGNISCSWRGSAVMAKILAMSIFIWSNMLTAEMESPFTASLHVYVCMSVYDSKKGKIGQPQTAASHCEEPRAGGCHIVKHVRGLMRPTAVEELSGMQLTAMRKLVTSNNGANKNRLQAAGQIFCMSDFEVMKLATMQKGAALTLSLAAQHSNKHDASMTM